MEPPGHGAWELADFRSRPRRSRAYESALVEEELHRRARRRTEPFERVAENIAHIRVDQAELNRAMRAVAGELSRRRRDWRIGARPSRLVHYLSFAACIAVPATPMILMMAVWGVRSWVMILGFVLALSLVILTSLLASRLRLFRFDSASDPNDVTLDRAALRHCPDCDYDLDGLPPALPPDKMFGVDVGPRHCPECGGLWPLVPPP